MTPLKTALILRLHNAWRRGDDETAPNMTQPKLLGEAIDTAIALIEMHDEILAALKDSVSVAKTARDHWDKDQDSKVGKYLIALSGGLPGYDKRTDEIHAAIAKAKAITS